MGLSIGLGVALGMRLDENPRKAYIIMGDGELAEGQVWEAAMAAAFYKADNLVAIVDNNKLQAMGPIADRFDIGDIGAKFASFGWHVIKIDGHNVVEISTALDDADKIKGKPVVIIASTIKGKGVSFAEGVPAFHNAPSMTEEQYRTAISDIDSYVC